jgi:thiaminase (transcriptional activator TenA)
MNESLSEQMLRENRAAFDDMVGHRFVTDILCDRLDRDVFDRYLVYEGAFVETAIAIFAHATAKAATMAQKRWLIGVLDALANQQIAYFEKTLAERGVDPTRYDTDRAEVAAFRQGMLAIARDGGFLDAVAAMFAAEWMYWTWCAAANAKPISDPLLHEWVALHAAPEFAAQAKWLKNTLDDSGAALSSAERARLSAVFGETQRLEIAFHAAAYC